MDARFVANGKPKLLRLTAVMRFAAHQILLGHGLFTVSRGSEDGAYRHPDLKRPRALRVLRGMLKHGGKDTDVRVTDGKGKPVLHVRRAPSSVYQNPFRDAAGIRGLRQDQGVDYSVSRESPVYAIGPGVVTTYRPTSGWPWDAGHADGGAYIAIRFTHGPAAGKYYYDAEHIRLNPSLHVGSHVDVDTVIAHHLPGFANCELGWAAGPNGYSPLAEPYYVEGHRTAAGDNFDKFMRALGAPAGLVEGRPIDGHMPAGFPRDWKGKV